MKKILLFMLLGAGLAWGQRPSADLIVTNAKVYTVDAKHPVAEAVAVIGERIVAVGSAAEIDTWRGADTTVIDAGGKLVLPGFNDAHVHFLDGSSDLLQVKLKDAHTPQEFAKRIAEQVQRTKKGEWVLGGNWDDQGFDHPELPTRQMIDAVSPNTPVWVNRYDGHMSLANSLALKLAGITAMTPEPAGGVIVRDKDGQPTGILKDAAQDLVNRVVPPMSHEQRMRVLDHGMRYAASLGVTSVQDMNPSYEEVGAFSEFLEAGTLTMRVYAAPMETGWRDQANIGLRHAWGSSWLRLGAVKGYADGSLGSTTAYFFAPYTDAPNSHGLLSDEMHPVSAMRDRLTGADKAGLQLCIHAIGDRAISMTLDMFESILKANGPRDRRWRIEHSQHMAVKDFDRYAKLGVIASVQPYHAIDDGRWAEKRIGPERIKSSYAYRSFLDHGVKLAFGTDWPVAPLNPLEGVYAAVTRETLDGKNPNGWVPEQKLTVAESVYAYTMGSAYAEFQEAQKGSITPGKLADMVVLSDDIFSIPKDEIKDVRVMTTIVGGKVLYTRAGK